MNEHQRFVRRVTEEARIWQHKAIIARRKADRAVERARTPRAIFWAQCLQHGAEVIEEKAAFAARTAQMAHEVFEQIAVC